MNDQAQNQIAKLNEPPNQGGYRSTNGVQAPTSIREVRCHNCKKVGHKKNECKAEKKWQPRQQKQNGFVADQVRDLVAQLDGKRDAGREKDQQDKEAREEADKAEKQRKQKEIDDKTIADTSSKIEKMLGRDFKQTYKGKAHINLIRLTCLFAFVALLWLLYSLYRLPGVYGTVWNIVWTLLRWSLNVQTVKFMLVLSWFGLFGVVQICMVFAICSNHLGGRVPQQHFDELQTVLDFFWLHTRKVAAFMGYGFTWTRYFIKASVVLWYVINPAYRIRAYWKHRIEIDNGTIDYVKKPDLRLNAVQHIKIQSEELRADYRLNTRLCFDIAYNFSDFHEESIIFSYTGGIRYRRRGKVALGVLFENHTPDLLGVDANEELADDRIASKNRTAVTVNVQKIDAAIDDVYRGVTEIAKIMWHDRLFDRLQRPF